MRATRWTIETLMTEPLQAFLVSKKQSSVVLTAERQHTFQATPSELVEWCLDVSGLTYDWYMEQVKLLFPTEHKLPVLLRFPNETLSLFPTFAKNNEQNEWIVANAIQNFFACTVPLEWLWEREALTQSWADRSITTIHLHALRAAERASERGEPTNDSTFIQFSNGSWLLLPISQAAFHRAYTKAIILLKNKNVIHDHARSASKQVRRWSLYYKRRQPLSNDKNA